MPLVCVALNNSTQQNIWDQRVKQVFTFDILGGRIYFVGGGAKCTSKSSGKQTRQTVIYCVCKFKR